MSDPVVSVSGIAVPGLKISYGLQLSDGVSLVYEAGVDSTVAKEDLNELLDRVSDAAERQRCKRDLPKARDRLAKNVRMLLPARRRVAEADRQSNAHIAQLSQNRRKDVPMLATDVNEVKAANDYLVGLLQQIELDKLVIAYFEAIIDGREPPLPPELQDDTSAIAAE